MGNNRRKCTKGGRRRRRRKKELETRMRGRSTYEHRNGEERGSCCTALRGSGKKKKKGLVLTLKNASQKWKAEEIEKNLSLMYKVKQRLV